MTTPNIPEAAVQAVAEVLQRAEANDDAPNPHTTDIAWWCRDVAADILTAALPLLGDTERAASAQLSLAKARAERDEALRELRTESAERLQLAEAIQRIRDLPMKGNQVASDEWDAGYLACEADVERALDGVRPRKEET